METLRVIQGPRTLGLVISRPESQNSINEKLIDDFHRALDRAETDQSCRLIVIEGANGVFCTGMDFAEVVSEAAAENHERMRSFNYIELLRRLTSMPKVIIAKVDGRVTAGGVGFVAASDLVVASKRSQFGLSEALWGLLPCCVLPYLIRKIGFQPAYRMTLTTQTVSAQEACNFHLVDEVTDDLDDAIRRWMLRLGRLEEETIRELKLYFQKMWQISAETEEFAVKEITRLVSKPQVIQNITNFVTQNQFPWEQMSNGGKK
jgi:3-carboxymethyl-3-hydroxy-acyl-[acp] dehydratase